MSPQPILPHKFWAPLRTKPLPTQVHDPYPFPPGLSPTLTPIDFPPSPEPRPISFFDLTHPQPDRFHALDHFRYRRNIKLHPYSDEDAPYMQAYDPVLLQNDRYTLSLFQKINQNGTPLFGTYSNPPSNALDLGCGPGDWVLDAAAAWRAAGTKVVGLDLVDVFNEEWMSEKASMPNVEFVRGNFIKYKLPFPDAKFDLVRMANLSLCIPYDKWEFVLEEVHRVLSRNGRLEFIDDQIFFPYANTSSRPSSTASSSRRTSSDFSDSDDQDEEGIDLTFCPRPAHGFPDQHQKLTERSMHLETIFEDMLVRRYGIHPRPHLFVPQLLENIFGSNNVSKLPNKHLMLAPSDQPSLDGRRDANRSSFETNDSSSASESSLPSLYRKMSRYSPSRDKEKRADKLDHLDSSLKEEAFVEANRRMAARRDDKPTQSPGLVLYPSKFIPFTPQELEMHASKHMHTLIGCSWSIGEFIAQFKDEQGRPLVDEQAFRDFMWDYESFRRRRFNWPSDIPQMLMEEKSTLSRKSSTLTNMLMSGLSKRKDEPSYKHEELTHVRTIRVFEAFKAGN